MEDNVSTEETKALIRRYLNAISGKPKPASLVDQYIADSDPGLKEHIRTAELDFPSYELVTDAMIAEGDLAALRLRMRATHRPTGKQVDVPVLIFYRVADGKIAEHWVLMDNETMMKQLGAVAA
jgi:predicted SnoaL-like aldol condensation-catalyzing enzyme